MIRQRITEDETFFPRLTWSSDFLKKLYVVAGDVELMLGKQVDFEYSLADRNMPQTAFTNRLIRLAIEII